MKKLIVCILSVTLLVLTLLGCTQKGKIKDNTVSDSDGKLNIVATIFPTYDLTRAVTQDKVNLTMLVKPGSEIHSYEPSPSDIIKIQNADVFIYIGGENDAWVDKILNSMDVSKKKIIKLMDSVNAVQEKAVEGMEAEDGDEKEKAKTEKEKVEYDEHIWTSPQNAILMTNAIRDAICGIDVKNADTYKKNAAAYAADIQKVDDEIRGIVNASPNKLLVFGDRFPFRYFADEFGLDYRAAFNGCSSETEASAGTLKYLIETIKSKKISHVFYIEMSNQNIAKAISEQTGAEMIMLHSCQNVTKDEFDSGATYLSLMKKNAENLRKGLN